MHSKTIVFMGQCAYAIIPLAQKRRNVTLSPIQDAFDDAKMRQIWFRPVSASDPP